MPTLDQLHQKAMGGVKNHRYSGPTRDLSDQELKCQGLGVYIFHSVGVLGARTIRHPSLGNTTSVSLLIFGEEDQEPSHSSVSTCSRQVPSAEQIGAQGTVLDRFPIIPLVTCWLPALRHHPRHTWVQNLCRSQQCDVSWAQSGGRWGVKFRKRSHRLRMFQSKDRRFPAQRCQEIKWLKQQWSCGPNSEVWEQLSQVISNESFKTLIFQSRKSSCAHL